jgi:L-ascorbate metabolism protein UlaG (beta-lactamase superfamily)
MYVTWLDSNSWLLEMGGQRILVDPWLVGSLVFGNLPWLFKGDRPQPRAIPDAIDLILLTQGLEDHAHPPTLKVLDHTIPVVGSANAAKVVTELGYQRVTALPHGETYRLGDRLEIQSVPGSPIGPTLVENGYILRELDTGFSFYYEPHGFHAPEVRQSTLDVVMTPVMDIALPLVGAILKGRQNTLELAKQVTPQVILPTAEPGDVEYSGFLISLLKAVGGADELQRMLTEAGLSTQVVAPKPGDRTELTLQPRTMTTAGA